MNQDLAVRLFALLVTSTLVAQTPVFELYGNTSGATFANHVSATGDVNGDGFGDFVVGIRRDSGGVGAARVYSGRDCRVLHTFRGDNRVREEFGSSVGAAGDVDGDGFADIIVSSSGNSKNGVDAGAIVVFSGKSGRPLHVEYGDGPGDLFGVSVGTAGDVDRDGFDDFIVGAPENGGDPVKYYGSGYARLFSGRSGATLHTFRGTAIGDEFGAAVAAAGDIDKDGHPDVMVSSLLERIGGGSVRVYSGKNYKAIHTIFAEPGADHFGMSVSTALDVNRDGYLDFVVGSINPFSYLPGTVWVFSGRDGAALFKIRGSARSGMFGHSVGALGDVNGDGYADFLAGDPMDRSLGTATGSVRVFSGRDGRQLSVIYGPGGGFGTHSSVIGDLGRDGIPEFAVAAMGALRGGRQLGLVTVFSLANVTSVGEGCGSGSVHPRFDMTHPAIGRPVTLFLGGAARSAGGALLLSGVPGLPVQLAGPCFAYLDPANSLVLSGFTTDPSGRWSVTVTVPNDKNLIGARLALQCALGPSPAPLGIDLSNGVYVTVGS